MLARRTILVVDDTPQNIQMISSVLRDTYRIKVATSGEKALAVLQGADEKPDLVLLDVSMPGMDGYEVCRRLKTDPSAAAIPVIFLTASTAVDEEARGFEVGAVDYIHKPFSPPILRARVETHLALRAARRDVARAIEDGQPGRLVGRTIGGYALLEVLGRGGMGEVYRAERLADRREVAIKVLHWHLGWQGDAVARFQREFELVTRIRARGVAEILDAGETAEGVHYLVMELLRGEDMAALLRRHQRVSLGDLLDIVEPLAEVLEAAHAVGIIHRDVKPSNVFLARDAGVPGVAVKLLDFGVARLLEPADEGGLTTTFSVVGTPAYLAPEQVDVSLSRVRPQTDVFALGTVVYRALTGQPTFAATNVAAIFEAVLHGEPIAPSERVSGLSTDVDAVLALALAKGPSERYASARAFAVDLRAAHEGTLAEEIRERARRLGVFSSVDEAGGERSETSPAPRR